MLIDGWFCGCEAEELEGGRGGGRVRGRRCDGARGGGGRGGGQHPWEVLHDTVAAARGVARISRRRPRRGRCSVWRPGRSRTGIYRPSRRSLSSRASRGSPRGCAARGCAHRRAAFRAGTAGPASSWPAARPSPGSTSIAASSAPRDTSSVCLPQPTARERVRVAAGRWSGRVACGGGCGGRVGALVHQGRGAHLRRTNRAGRMRPMRGNRTGICRRGSASPAQQFGLCLAPADPVEAVAETGDETEALEAISSYIRSRCSRSDDGPQAAGTPPRRPDWV